MLKLIREAHCRMPDAISVPVILVGHKKTPLHTCDETFYRAAYCRPSASSHPPLWEVARDQRGMHRSNPGNTCFNVDHS